MESEEYQYFFFQSVPCLKRCMGKEESSGTINGKRMSRESLNAQHSSPTESITPLFLYIQATGQTQRGLHYMLMEEGSAFSFGILMQGTSLHLSALQLVWKNDA